MLLTRSEQETERVGRGLSRHLRAGDWVALTGPLGSGKTVLCRGIARGLGVPAPIPVLSPTFVLHRRYAEGRLPLDHVDAYRLRGAEDWWDLDPEIHGEGRGVLVIEWAERLEAVLPPEAIAVRIEGIGEEERRIHIHAPGRPEICAAVTS